MLAVEAGELTLLVHLMSAGRLQLFDARASLRDRASRILVRLDDGREVRYPFVSLYALTHAYAASVHKAQGSEFPAVVIPLLMTHAPMLGRTLLYTALTRARQLVVLVGQKRALALAVKDWRRAARQTALEGLLTGALQYAWPAARDVDEGAPDELDDWEGLVGSGPEP
jgi:hypothetical protein